MAKYDVVIIGGGASGMMASIFSAQRGLKTLVLEHNEKLGKKLFITGKGRCNLTNNSSIENHLNNIVVNNKFMYSALNAFSAQDVMQFFIDNGLDIKTERGNRVFPSSDKSSDVIRCLERCMKKYAVEVRLNTDVMRVIKQDGHFNIYDKYDNIYTTNSVIVATGGLSYPGTGSTGFGYKIARDFGHKIVECKSALCPILVNEDIRELNGLSLKNVSLNINIGNKKFSSQGEMMFTYNSLTGPIVLSLSSLINKLNYKNAKIFIDLKPGLTIEQLEIKLTRECVDYAKKDFKNYLHTLLPNKLVDYFYMRCGVENKKMADINRFERDKIINLLKKFDFSIKSLDNIDVGIITSGGVDVREINSKSCESKLVENLYFIGEVLDIDALTGGYNLQIAWSTAYLAANHLKG